MAMGAGEARRQWMATAGGSEENGADGKHGGAAAGGGDTRNATSAAADKVGAGGHHGEKNVARERFAGRKENPAREPYGVGVVGEGCEAYIVVSDPSGVGRDGGGREAYGVAENPGGERQGVGGGVESPQGIDTPGVDALPRRGENPGVENNGDRVTGEDGRGQGGDGNSPTTRASADSRANDGNDGVAHGPRTAAFPHPSGTAADNDSVGPLPRQSDSADGARPENGMHLRRKYGLLAPEEPEGSRSNAGPRARGDGHRATRGTV